MSAMSSFCVVAESFRGRLLLVQVDEQIAQNQNTCWVVVKNWFVGRFQFLSLFVLFFNQIAREARLLPSLSPFILFKLVCILAIPNNSRMLLQSKLIKIRFWKREKKQQLNIDIFMWANTATDCRKKKVSNLNARLLLYSRKETEFVCFSDLGRKKKAYQHWYFFSLKRIRGRFFRLWLSSHEET